MPSTTLNPTRLSGSTLPSFKDLHLGAVDGHPPRLLALTLGYLKVSGFALPVQRWMHLPAATYGLESRVSILTNPVP